MGHRRHEHWDMSNLGIGRAFATVIAAAGLVGAFVGWLASQVFVHLHTNGESSHPASVHHAPRDMRG